VTFLDHHRRRLDAIRSEYEEELRIIKTEFEDERQLINECHQSELQHLQDIMFAMEQNHQEKEADARGEFQSMRDEIKNKVDTKDFFCYDWRSQLVFHCDLRIKSHF